MFTRLFWKDTVERVVASAAGGALTVLSLDGFDAVASTAKVWLIGVGVPALTSLAKALVALRRDDTVSPASLARVEPPEVPAHDPQEN